MKPTQARSKLITGGATSRGNVLHGTGRVVGESKIRVEGGKLISESQFRKEMNDAINGFWSRRPHLDQMRGGMRSQYGKQEKSAWVPSPPATKS